MLKCIHCGGGAFNTLCTACASMIRGNTIEEAKEISIRSDERRKIAAEIQQLLHDRMGALNSCGPKSPQRPIHQGGVVALTAVLAKLGVKPNA